MLVWLSFVVFPIIFLIVVIVGIKGQEGVAVKSGGSKMLPLLLTRNIGALGKRSVTQHQMLTCTLVVPRLIMLTAYPVYMFLSRACRVLK
ncbi:MAG: hypothetical protein LBU53_13950 [Zoogloeaceae bacterium]|jgi:hypothetical protein|nr:hypothetical protein [Zoogloeaceae bacterium]